MQGLLTGKVEEGVGQVIRVRDQLREQVTGHLGAQCSGAVVRSPLWRIILGDDERKIVWGQSWTLFSRPREATDLSFGKCHSEGWLVGRESGNLLRKKLY